jgi:serine/threonine protein phosphatase PrpC
MFMTVCGVTDTGMVRSNNEDALCVVDLSTLEQVGLSGTHQLIEIGPRGLLAVVSDGMGGEKAGEVASATTIQAMQDSLAAAAADTDAGKRLMDSVAFANERVLAAASESERKGMGATVVAVIVDGKHAWTAEVGDSRAYVFRQGNLIQISKDQTFTQLLLERGIKDPALLAGSQAKNVILQAVGKLPELSIAQRKLELRRGDVLLLCSDGLHGLVPNEEIEAVLSSNLEEAAPLLIALANERGGNDNITVLVATMADDTLPEPSVEQTVEDTCQTVQEFAFAADAPGKPKD